MLYYNDDLAKKTVRGGDGFFRKRYMLQVSKKPRKMITICYKGNLLQIQKFIPTCIIRNDAFDYNYGLLGHGTM
jgi:hypothetical protein